METKKKYKKIKMKDYELALAELGCAKLQKKRYIIQCINNINAFLNNDILNNDIDKKFKRDLLKVKKYLNLKLKKINKRKGLKTIKIIKSY
jgi:hypothetical protein